MYTDQTNNLRICDGVIETHKGEQVVGIFPTTEEGDLTNMDILLKDVHFPLTAYESYEVLLVRVYYHGGEWLLSTKRKLDAYDSYWANKYSIGEQFENIVENICGITNGGMEVFLQSLDKNIRYFFLIPLEEKQRVGTHESPQNVFWLCGIEKAGSGVIQTEGLESLIGSWTCGVRKNLWSLVPSHRFENKDALHKFIAMKYGGTLLTGAVIITNNRFIRIVHPLYKYLTDLRANEPNIFRRFLALKKEVVHRVNAREQKDLDIFVSQHQEYLGPFMQDYKEFITEIWSTYMARYIRKEKFRVSQRANALLRKCHEFYIQKRAPVTRNVIEEVLLSNFPPKVILKIMKEPIKIDESLGEIQ